MVDKKELKIKNNNTGLAKVSVQFSADTFVVNQTFVLKNCHKINKIIDKQL